MCSNHTEHSSCSQLTRSTKGSMLSLSSTQSQLRHSPLQSYQGSHLNCSLLSVRGSRRENAWASKGPLTATDVRPGWKVYLIITFYLKKKRYDIHMCIMFICITCMCIILYVLCKIYTYSIYSHVCALCTRLVPEKAKRHCISWNWSFTRLRATM